MFLELVKNFDDDKTEKIITEIIDVNHSHSFSVTKELNNERVNNSLIVTYITEEYKDNNKKIRYLNYEGLQAYSNIILDYCKKEC